MRFVWLSALATALGLPVSYTHLRAHDENDAHHGRIPAEPLGDPAADARDHLVPARPLERHGRPYPSSAKTGVRSRTVDQAFSTINIAMLSV